MNQLPDSITNQYMRFADRILKLQVITIKQSFMVLVYGKIGLKVHYWKYENNGWRLQ